MVGEHSQLSSPVFQASLLANSTAKASTAMLPRINPQYARYKPERAIEIDVDVQSLFISSSLGPRARSISSSESEAKLFRANSVLWYPTLTRMISSRGASNLITKSERQHHVYDETSYGNHGRKPHQPLSTFPEIEQLNNDN
jgi:hypothetical protein